MTKNTDNSETTATPEEVNANLPAASVKHNNSDLWVWALEAAGGRQGYVDVEEVYMKCFELAPKRFGWRTRPETPDMRKLVMARREATKRQKRLGVVMFDSLENDVTSGKNNAAYQWRLTALGADWCDTYRARLEALYGGGTVPASPTDAAIRRTRELRASESYELWASKKRCEPSLIELADLLSCSPASDPRVFNQRLDRALEDSRQVGDAEVEEFISNLCAVRREQSQ